MIGAYLALAALAAGVVWLVAYAIRYKALYERDLAELRRSARQAAGETDYEFIDRVSRGEPK